MFLPLLSLSFFLISWTAVEGVLQLQKPVEQGIDRSVSGNRREYMELKRDHISLAVHTLVSQPHGHDGSRILTCAHGG